MQLSPSAPDTGQVPAGWRWAAVLGRPVAHSLSPALHRTAYRMLSADTAYVRQDTGTQELAQRIAAARSDPSWAGYSVTMPLKEAAAQAADGLTDFAAQVGVVNTLFPSRAGGDRPGIGSGTGSAASEPVEILGHNTDVAGIVNALADAGAHSVADPTSQGPRAAVLGGGGTATAAVVALRLMGARTATVYVRDPRRTGAVRAAAERAGIDLVLRPLDRAWSEMPGQDLVVSTLPAGALDDRLPVDSPPAPGSAEAGLLAGTAVLDVTYDPWPSALARAAGPRGAKVVSGRHMLLHQALDQVALFTGHGLADPLPDQHRLLAAMAEAVGIGIGPRPPRRVGTGEIGTGEAGTGEVGRGQVSPGSAGRPQVGQEFGSGD